MHTAVIFFSMNTQYLRQTYFHMLYPSKCPTLLDEKTIITSVSPVLSAPDQNLQ